MTPSAMPRQLRSIVPGIPHHAIQRGNNRQDVFFDHADRSYFLTILKENARKYGIRVGAYCLMTNHVHLLIWPETEQGLIQCMKAVAQLYTQRINWKYQRSGKLWENRYKLHLVEPACSWVVARYIELNPVRAGMTFQPEAYAYSSARAHLNGLCDEVISEDILLGRPGDYRRFLMDQDGRTEESLRVIRDVSQQQKILGSAGFVKSIEERLGVNLSVRNRGRPRTGK